MKKFILCVGFAFALAGCSTAKIEDYAQGRPAFDIRDYMNGKIEGQGLFVDRSGKADPMFHVDITGLWDGDDGVLKEHYVYNDGRVQDRLMHLHVADDHHFTGSADDIVGTATGAQYGNTVQMNYVLTVTGSDGSKHDLSANDWFYRMSDRIVIDRNELSKFGIRAGELIITFDKKR